MYEANMTTKSPLTGAIRAPALRFQLVPIRGVEGVPAVLVVVSVIPLLRLNLGDQPQGPGLQHVVVVALQLDAGQTQGGGGALRGVAGERGVRGQWGAVTRQTELLLIIIILVRKEKI